MSLVTGLITISSGVTRASALRFPYSSSPSNSLRLSIIELKSFLFTLMEYTILSRSDDISSLSLWILLLLDSVNALASLSISARFFFVRLRFASISSSSPVAAVMLALRLSRFFVDSSSSACISTVVSIIESSSIICSSR